MDPRLYARPPTSPPGTSKAVCNLLSFPGNLKTQGLSRQIRNAVKPCAPQHRFLGPCGAGLGGRWGADPRPARKPQGPGLLAGMLGARRELPKGPPEGPAAATWALRCCRSVAPCVPGQMSEEGQEGVCAAAGRRPFWAWMDMSAKQVSLVAWVWPSVWLWTKL